MLPSALPDDVGSLKKVDFAAQYPACLFPCQRFVFGLTVSHA
jgi:hypothetical protein